jgi:hypothetical protein
VTMFLARYRKTIAAALVPVFPLVAHFLHVGPLMSDNAAWWLFIVGEGTALGVYGVTNDPPGP